MPFVYMLVSVLHAVSVIHGVSVIRCVSVIHADYGKHGNRFDPHPRRRATGDEAGWRGRATDDDSVSVASKKEPCPLALWFQDACSDQAWHTLTPKISCAYNIQDLESACSLVYIMSLIDNNMCAAFCIAASPVPMNMLLADVSCSMACLNQLYLA